MRVREVRERRAAVREPMSGRAGIVGVWPAAELDVSTGAAVWGATSAARVARAGLPRPGPPGRRGAPGGCG
jgi:hypothetical protein